MFDEPFWDVPEHGTWGYRLLDSLLFLLMSIFWWVYWYTGILLLMLRPNTLTAGSEAEEWL
ncbi:MAG: hypothetical protein HY675_19600 [Chloroflexi bacterium]|nr:hypothetical protein [Chloroflexota bacterium]